MYKIVIAPDSFKGSISAKNAAQTIAKGIFDGAKGKINPVCVPIADGGEGTLETMVTEDSFFSLSVTGPLFTPITAAYGIKDGTAVIEMARAAGLTLVPEEKRAAAKTTTFGVGEMILDAIERGIRRILLTAGGSATNDGGAGMLAALGAHFLDQNGKIFIPTGENLEKVAEIDLSSCPAALKECTFTIATDVKNPLLGETGATYVYAKQKGASDACLAQMEKGMTHYAAILEEKTNKEIKETPGCGAGGGIGAPLLAFFNATVTSGIDAVLSALDFEKALKDADAVITGEGKMDVQSLYGKAISGVVRYAKKQHLPVYCFVGCVGDDEKALKAMGIEEIYTTVSLAVSAQDSIENAEKYLYHLGLAFAEKFISGQA